MYVLKIINHIYSISLTLPATNEHFIHQPHKFSVGHNLDNGQNFQNKKGTLKYSLHLYTNLQCKI